MGRKLLRAGIPGIVDVAAKPGVSPATVSRFYNSPEIVRYKTRQRIEDAAKSLGYVPNGVARSLNRGRSGTIGLIVPTIDNAIFAELAQAFSTALFRHSRTMLIAAHGYDLAREAILTETLLEHRVDALALVGLKHEEATFAQLERRGIPTVLMWNFRRRQRFPCIGLDNRDAGRIATEHLIELGHTDILFLVADPQTNDRAADRRAGALAAMNEAGLKVPPERICICPYDVPAAKEIVLKALTSKSQPTSILSGNDVIALGALFAAMSLGVRIPQDLSIVGIGDFRGSSAVEPGLTTVRIPARRIGRKAAESLIEMTEWPDSGAVYESRMSPELLVRGSTRQLP